ncbi:hypothetical protein ACVWWK_002256 [Bradyrhizobium sp. LB9.1b]
MTGMLQPSMPLTLDLPHGGPLAIEREALRILETLRSLEPTPEVRNAFIVLSRLATDPRMRNVWELLLERAHTLDGGTRPYRHSAFPLADNSTVVSFDPSSPDQCQSAMMAALFYAAFCLATFPMLVVRRSNRRPVFLLKCDDHDTFGDIEVDLPFDWKPSEVNIDLFREHIRAGQMSFWHVILFRRQVALMVSRGTVRHDRARCVGIGVAAMCQSAFGSKLRQTSATIASVALNIEIKSSQIRQWCEEILPVTAGM